MKKEYEKDDNDIEINKIIRLIWEFFDLNPQIDSIQWSSALWYILINGYKNSGNPPEKIRKLMNEVLDFYIETGLFDEKRN